jgi:phosphatidylglycerophosphate synthase
MSALQFSEATRIATNPLVGIERRLLVWMAERLPRQISPDHLTALALASMALTGVCYAVARGRPAALFLAIVGLILNWFGDSLDGTLARVRKTQRPRYGFYVDHIVDCFGVLFVLVGLGWSGFMTPAVAMAFLIAYLMLSIEIYLATYCLTIFRLSFWGVGPTELRLLLAAGTLALVNDPKVRLLGRDYLLFDVGAVVGTIGLLITLVVSVARNTTALYKAEPLS